MASRGRCSWVLFPVVALAIAHCDGSNPDGEGEVGGAGAGFAGSSGIGGSQADRGGVGGEAGSPGGGATPEGGFAAFAGGGAGGVGGDGGVCNAGGMCGGCGAEHYFSVLCSWGEVALEDSEYVNYSSDTACAAAQELVAAGSGGEGGGSATGGAAGAGGLDAGVCATYVDPPVEILNPESYGCAETVDEDFEGQCVIGSECCVVVSRFYCGV